MENLKKLSLLDIIYSHPHAEKIIKSYDEHAQTCLCCNNLFDTLEEVCKRYNIPEKEMIKKIKKA